MEDPADQALIDDYPNNDLSGNTPMKMRFWLIRVPQAKEILKKVEELGIVALCVRVREDVSHIKDREELRKLYRYYHPFIADVAAYAPVWQLYRVARVIKKNDWLLCPKKEVRTVLLGRVTQEYQYLPDALGSGYNHTLRVEWHGEIPFAAFSEKLRRGTVGASNVLDLERHRGKLLRLIKKNPSEWDGDANDRPISLAEEVKATSQDLIVQKLRDMDPQVFLGLVLRVYATMGYATLMSDLRCENIFEFVARKASSNRATTRTRVRVKHHWAQVKAPDVKNFIEALAPGESGHFIATAKFAETARKVAKSNKSICLIETKDFVALLVEHYGKLDSDHQAMIPLQNILVPLF